MGRSRDLQLHIKYIFDKLIAIIALLLTSPIFLIIGVILKIQGEDVFYLQLRLGQHGHEFEVFKFTTMPKGSEKQGLFTTTNDSRPTKLGKFLRKTKLNELPQLINILKGDMSFIGPRPIIKSQVIESLGEQDIKAYYQMRPGLTGAASLTFHHEDRLLAEVDDIARYYREVLMPKKLELEKEYAQNWNIFLDLKIFLKTIMALFNAIWSKA